jgi:hypothetical protein
MFEILFLSIRIFCLVLFCGLGFTLFFLPRSLIKKDLIWLSFWFGLILISLFGVVLSIGKVPMNQAKYVIILISFSFFVYSVLKKKILINNLKIPSTISIFTLIIFLFNIYPLLLKAGFPTTISLGNLDPISYNTVADFFKSQTVFQGKELSFYKPFLWSVGDLVHYSFRWGSPMILSFVASVFNIRAYQIFSILITLIYSLTYPLICLLAKIISKNKTIYLSIIIFFTYGFNSTMLYMLYNVFFAQFLFTGILILILIIFSSYLIKTNYNLYKINSYDFIIGLLIASLSNIYPEGLSFVLISWLIFILFKIFSIERYKYLIIFTKIILIAAIVNPYNMGTAIRWNFSLFVNTTKTTWIGWENIRYASPFEFLGFYNLYFSRVIPKIISYIVNFPIIIIWIISIFKIKNKALILSQIATFVAFCFIYKFVYPNYFTFHKSITYSIFIYSILFAVGLTEIKYLMTNKLVKLLIIIIIALLTIRSSLRTISQIYYHPRIVDKSLTSLEILNKNKDINEPFYTSDVYLGEYDLWKRLWREYLLKDKLIVSRQNYNQEGLNKKTIKLYLSEKNMMNYDNKKIIYKNIIWKNDYYELGEIKK